MKYRQMLQHGLWKHYVKSKKLDTKDHIMCNSIYMNAQNRQIHGGRKHISGSQRLMVVSANGYGVFLWSDENILDSVIVMVVQPCEYTKNYWIVHFKMVNFMVCKLYLNNNKTQNDGHCLINQTSSNKHFKSQLTFTLLFSILCIS